MMMLLLAGRICCETFSILGPQKKNDSTGETKEICETCKSDEEEREREKKKQEV